MGDNHSLSEKVFHKLQEDILSGKYAVDEELKEKTIGDELGGSAGLRYVRHCVSWNFRGW